jgi:hypothetical protein
MHVQGVKLNDFLLRKKNKPTIFRPGKKGRHSAESLVNKGTLLKCMTAKH